MARKKNSVTEVESSQTAQSEPKFTKQQMLASAKYKDRKDLVSVLLDDGRMYTIDEVDQMVDKFMKGKVE